MYVCICYHTLPVFLKSNMGMFVQIFSGFTRFDHVANQFHITVNFELAVDLLNE